MLTYDETRVVAHAYALRHDEAGEDLWFCPGVDVLADAVRLHERHYLDRRWHGDDLVYRLSDEAMTAQELSNLVASANPN